MNKRSGENISCTIEEQKASEFNAAGPRPLYGVFLFEGEGSLRVDFIDCNFKGHTVLFTTPWQMLQFNSPEDLHIRALLFHADYYDSQAHKKVVACDGLPLNDINSNPFIRSARR